MDKTKSKTEKDSFWEERIIGTSHYKTTISDGKDKVVKRGNSAKEAEERASKAWEKKKEDS